MSLLTFSTYATAFFEFDAEDVDAWAIAALSCLMAPNPPRSGLYFIRLTEDDAEFQVARYEAGEWWLIGLEETFAEVAEVGPVIEVPTVA